MLYNYLFYFLYLLNFFTVAPLFADKLAILLADQLASVFGQLSSDFQHILRVSTKQGWQVARQLGASNFRLQLGHRTHLFGTMISAEMAKIFKKNRSFGQLLKMFDEGQLYLSEGFMSEYLAQKEGSVKNDPRKFIN